MDDNLIIINMINYKMVSKRDPRDAQSAVSYHALAISSGTSDLRTIANKISDRSTLTTVDTMAVLEALVSLIPQELADGKIVKLGDFGSFRISLRSEGSASPDDFSKNLITETKVHFRQGSEFRRKFQGLGFAKQAG